MSVPVDYGPVRSAWASVGLAAVLTGALFAALPLLGRLPPVPEEPVRVQQVHAVRPQHTPMDIPPKPEVLVEPSPIVQSPLPPAAPPLPMAPMESPALPRLAVDLSALPTPSTLAFRVMSASVVAGPSNGIWGIHQVDARPQAVRRTAPLYPARARLRGLEGSVELLFVVDVTGRVQGVEVDESKPEGVFDRAAVAAVKAWRFKPGTREGKPVAVRVRQVLDFHLEAGR